LTSDRDIRPFISGMRSPVVAPLTRFLIGLPLVLLPTQTARFFAWTIEPPLTAAVLGANYWASALLAVVASRERSWAAGRISISVAVVFAPLTTAATLIHLDKFNLDSFYGWFWIVAYAIYPPMLGFLLYRQLQVPGGDPPRTRPLDRWVRVTFAIHALLMIPLGVALFVAPEPVGRLWPWVLTPLTGRVMAAWVIALGVLAAHAIWENDSARIRSALAAYPFLGAMHVAAVLRFTSDLEAGPAAWIYAAVVTSTFALGIYGWRERRRVPRGKERLSDAI
jgi:hypothetical protein